MSALLIDTNIYSYAMRGDSQVIDVLSHLSKIGICAISMAELLSGFKAGNREALNRDELNQFLDSPRVQLYGVDEDTAEFYSLIVAQLKSQGTPIPTNDIWIAAVAMQQGLAVFTKDKHFSHIAGLIVKS